MGNDQAATERLLLVGAGAFILGLVIPAYPGVVARLAARGVELTWAGHLGLLAALVALSVAALAMVVAACRAVGWVAERLSRRAEPGATPDRGGD
jgi:hypothetical protein